MKALVVAGGLGSRLRPLTQTGAKQLLPVANKPIIHYVLEDISAAGISEVGVLVGTETAAGIQGDLKDGSRWGLAIQYIFQEKPLGIAHCIIVAEEYLQGDCFVMYLGDNLLQGGIGPYAAAFQKDTPNAMVLLSQVVDPREFGVAEFDETGQISKFIEKPSAPPSDWAMTGIYFFDGAILEAVHAIRPSRRNELEITDAIQWLLEHGYAVQHQKHTGWWKDTGKPEDLLEANLLVLQDLQGVVDNTAVIDGESRLMGQVKVGPGAEIKRSVIRGPVIIGARSKIKDSYIGASTSLGIGSVVKHTEVSCSIIMDGAILDDVPVPIDWSIVGRDAMVHRAYGRPKALNLILGDVSRVELV